MRDETHWYTVLDPHKSKYATDVKNRTGLFDDKPGFKVFALKKGCPKPSDTWRFANIKPMPGTKTRYASLFEIKLDVPAETISKSIRKGGVLPALGRTQMRVMGDGIKTAFRVTTHMKGASINNKCVEGLMPTTTDPSRIVTPMGCDVVTDGDVNTPVIFNKKSEIRKNSLYVLNDLYPKF